MTELATTQICSWSETKPATNKRATGMLGEATGMSTDLGMRSFTLMERVFSKLDIPKA